MKPEKQVKKQKVIKKKGNNTMIIGIVVVIVLVGAFFVLFGGNSDDSTGKTMTLKEARAKIDAEYGKIGEGTNTPPVTDNYIPVLSSRPADQLPSYVYTNPTVLKAYKFATEHPEILEQIPCYCGCGGHSGHRYLRDCFIHDDGTYDDHASFCDVCIGEAIKVQSYLGLQSGAPASGNPVPPVKSQSVDLSSLALPDNFNSLSDGLKLIPPGIGWAYFANLEQGTGIEQQGYMPGEDFYGLPIVGMLNSEYKDGSWVELHDVGKDNANARSNAGINVDNVLSTRPYIFDTKDKTDSVLAILKGQDSNTAYDSFRSILEKVDDEKAGFAKVNTSAAPFADMSYFGLIKSGNDIIGEIAFHIKNNGTIPQTNYQDLKNSSSTRGFKSYEVLKEDDILIIRMTSNLESVILEAKQNYGIEI